MGAMPPLTAPPHGPPSPFHPSKVLGEILGELALGPFEVKLNHRWAWGRTWCVGVGV
jgi:hypothetical protein